MAVAMGLVPHTGWAWLVRVCGRPGAPEVEGRAKVVACDVPAGQLYHLAAERRRDQARFVERQRAALLAQAGRTLAPHLRGVASAMVLGPRRVLPPLERILAAHPLLHAAEGELWRALFAEAFDLAGGVATRAAADEIRDLLAARHGRRAVASFLAAGGRRVGPPWGREPQDAALAGWCAVEADRGPGQGVV